jgi:phosphatidylinositol alpha-1,6-mannosyltransferase
MEKDLIISEDWSPKVGGAHFWLENTYKRWPNDVMVFTAYKSRSSTDQAIDGYDVEPKEGGLKVQRALGQVSTISISPKSWFSIYSNVMIVRCSLPAVQTRVHCKAYFPEGLVGALVKRSSRKVSKLVIYAHGEEINVAKSSRLLHQIARWVYGSADLVIVNSKNTEKMVHSLVPSAKTIVIHPGVDVARIEAGSKRRNETRNRYAWTDDVFVVLTIARLEPRKNVIRVIEALHRLRLEGHNVRYVVAGRGEAMPDIREKILQLGAKDWVTILEAVSDSEKSDLLGAANLFVMASVSDGLMIEGFGIVFLEAAAAGIPSISGSDGGQREAVLNGLTGYNVDGNSVDAIREGIARVINDEGTTSGMGKRAKAWAEQNDWSEIAAKTLLAVS